MRALRVTRLSAMIQMAYRVPLAPSALSHARKNWLRRLSNSAERWSDSIGFLLTAWFPMICEQAKKNNGQHVIRFTNSQRGDRQHRSEVLRCRGEASTYASYSVSHNPTIVSADCFASAAANFSVATPSGFSLLCGCAISRGFVGTSAYTSTGR